MGRDYDEIEKTWSPEIFVRETEAEVRAIGGSTFGEPFDSWQAGNLVGTPEQVIDRIGQYVDMGVTVVHPLVPGLPVDRHDDARGRAGDPVRSLRDR